MITLKTLPEATEQEVFDQVAEHLLKQNEQSFRGSICAYRGEHGLKCAAGCLIADDEYSEEWDDEEWDECGINWSELVNKGLASPAHATLVSKLQAVHDGYSQDYWKSQLAKVADYFKLNTQVLLNFE